MRKAGRAKRHRLSHQGWPWLIVALLALVVWIDGEGLSMPRWDGGLAIHSPSQARLASLQPSSVIDGDTVRVQGETFRLVGFDTPETGERARCAYESDLGDRATQRLRDLIGSATSIALTPVPCACRPGTHGTSQCNYGRSCAMLRADGRDVGGILIAERLARPYSCGTTGCPRRGQWC
jgi:endonuclease YncB( thermonuclease family)